MSQESHEAALGASILPLLKACLPEPPARIVGVGWPQGAAKESDLDLRWVADMAEAGACDAILWNASEIRPDPAALVGRAHRLLSDQGTLIAACPPGRRPASKGWRGLPSKDEKHLRRVVRELSEAGFALPKDRHVEGWTVLVARKDPFLIRTYRDGDEEAILRLFPTCFHVERSRDHWRWKYAQNPYGNHTISMTFSPESELTAHYAGYPIPFWSEGREYLAIQLGDTMTNPEFRTVGRGHGTLLARTTRHFFAVYRGPFGFFFGFNTGPIARFCRWFIGASQVAPVGYWSRALDPRPEPASGYRVERITRVDGAWDRFFRRVAPHYGFLVRRDAGYVDWRYLCCLDVDFVILAARRWGRLVGWSVFRRRDDRLVWGDALFDPRHVRAARALLAAAVSAPESAGASRVEAWFPERPRWWRERLPELGFTAGPEPSGLVVTALADAEEDALERLRELYYTMGDGDLF